MTADLLHLWRNLRRSPASAIAAIVTLSLTIGVGTAILAVVHAVLLTPPPFADPDALVTLGEAPLDDPVGTPRPVPYATFESWRERAGSLAALEGFDGTNLTLTGAGPAHRVSVTDATPALLDLLGVTPALGRGFEEADVGRPVAMVSHAFWHGRLAADPGVIGRPVVLGDQPHTVVGVLPEGFVFELGPAEFWRPLPLVAAQAARSGYRLTVVARLAAHASPSALERALGEISRGSSPPSRVVATPVAAAIAGDAGRTLVLLAGAAALAGLVAFTNFAGLLVVRAIDRRRELAIRRALGARHVQIARHLLVESQALVALGTAGGVLLALWLTPAAARIALEQAGGAAHRQVDLDWQVLAAVVIAASACAWLSATFPAVLAVRSDITSVLRRGVTAPPGELRLRRAFVAAEVALAFVLLALVMVLGRSLLLALRTDPGFDARGVLTLQVSVPANTYDADRVVSFYSALQSALEGRLGPRSAAVINEIPLTGDGGRAVVGARAHGSTAEAVVREAGPQYFDLMRIPVVSGRAFDARDDSSAPPRAVISESLARRLFPGEDPVGRAIRVGENEPAELIGIVGDVRHRAIDEVPLPTAYLSARQAPSRSNVIVLRSARPEGDVASIAREEVARLDGNVPVYRVRPLEDVVRDSPGMPARRLLGATFTAFALLALVLGAIGLFGALAHDVASRRAELALRIALGAAPARIAGAILRQSAAILVPGLAFGAVLSFWATRALGEAAGFATGPLDALTVGLPATILIVTAGAAVLPVARRAARTDPLVVLRSE